MGATIQLPGGLKVLNPAPEITKYFNNANTPYTNVAQVLSEITSGIRHQGLTVNVAGVEYWFKDGILDAHLVPKVDAALGDKNYIHDQGVSASVWTITHNLNKYPSVTVKDTAGTEVEGEVIHISVNQLTITFSAGFSGVATLN
jgi:hypothetical protein